MVRHGWRGVFWWRLACGASRRREAPHAQPAHCPAAPAVAMLRYRNRTVWRHICDKSELATASVQKEAGIRWGFLSASTRGLVGRGRSVQALQ